MTDTQTITDFLKNQRKLADKTARGYANSIKKLGGIDNDMDEFKSWITSKNLEELHKNIKDADVSDRTKINYYKALKSVMRLPDYPTRDCKKKAKEEGKTAEEIGACSYLEGCKDICASCDKAFDELNSADCAVRESGEKSEAQKKNMVEWSVIEKMAKNPVKELKKMGVDIQKKGIKFADDIGGRNRQYAAVQRAVLAHLYGGLSHHINADKVKTINPPRRTDYVGHIDKDGSMKPTRWSEYVEDGDLSTNVLEHKKNKSVWGFMRFHLHHHKESGIQGTQIMEVHDKPTIKLLLLLKNWGKEIGNNDDGAVFLRQQAGDRFEKGNTKQDGLNWSKPMTPNNLLNHLYKIFNHDGKVISVDVLRHCWKTSKFGKAMKDYSEDCKLMGHTEEVGKQYVKSQ